MSYIDSITANNTNYTIKDGTIATHSNISVNVTPTAVSSYNTWDTNQEYGYEANITILGVTEQSLILNLVMDEVLLGAIAPIVTTGENKVTVYTKNNTTLQGTIYSITIQEIEGESVVTVNGLTWESFNYSAECAIGGSSFNTQYRIDYVTNSGQSSSVTFTLQQAIDGYIIPDSNIYVSGSSSQIMFGYKIVNPNDNNTLTVITNSYSFRTQQTINLIGYKLVSNE